MGLTTRSHRGVGTCHRGASVGMRHPPARGDRRRGTVCLFGDTDEVTDHQVAGGKSGSGPGRESIWADTRLPICLVLLISVPVMAVEEGWHSRPMIDEESYLWILPALLVAATFVFGGALAGFRCPSFPGSARIGCRKHLVGHIAARRSLSQGLDRSRRDAERRPLPLVPRRDRCFHVEHDRVVVRSSAGDCGMTRWARNSLLSSRRAGSTPSPR